MKVPDFPVQFPPQSKKPIATDGLLWIHQPDWLSSPVPRTATVIKLPEDHLPGRHVDHSNLASTRHCPCFGSHGHCQRAVVHQYLVACSYLVCSRQSPMWAFQSQIALNAKVAGFLVSYLSHYFSSVVLILLGQCEMRMTIFSHTRSAQSDIEPRRTTPAGIPNDQHRSGWTKGKEGMEGMEGVCEGLQGSYGAEREANLPVGKLSLQNCAIPAYEPKKNPSQGWAIQFGGGVGIPVDRDRSFWFVVEFNRL